jgi:hypothetical protein
VALAADDSATATPCSSDCDSAAAEKVADGWRAAISCWISSQDRVYRQHT